jgi:hypothetical protein
MAQIPSELHPAYFRVRFRTDHPAPAWPASFAIITAYATTGEAWSDARHTEADQRLYDELVALGHRPVRATGYDPASGHAEPGWAAPLPLEEAHALGLKYLQDAIFHVEGDILSVWCCGPGGEHADMGSFRERVDAP